MATLKEAFEPTLANNLPNGAVIIDRVFNSDGWVWLAYRADAFLPYVTWRSNRDSPGFTYSGNYFKEMQHAAFDFAERKEL